MSTIRKYIKLTLAFIAVLAGVSETYGQCSTLYPGGLPNTNVTWCTNTPGVTLDATSPSTLVTGYTWSNGDTTSSTFVTSSGTYTVTVATSGNPNACIITFTVTAVTPTIPNLGNDTSICPGDSIVLYAGAGYPDYLWSTGANGVDSIITSIADTYSVTITDANNCQGWDTIIVSNFTITPINLGNDTSICVGDSLLLDAGAGFVSYTWTTGATTQTVYADTIGNYGVVAIDTNGCSSADAILVLHHPVPAVNIGPDDTICDGLSKTLNAGGGFSSYLWSDGSQLQTLIIDTAGSYWVEVTDTNQCKARDTMNLVLHPKPPVNLGPDVSICIGDSATLDAGPGYVQYTWNNGAAGQTLTVSATGNYSVTVLDSNNCLNDDTVLVTVNPLPVVSLGADIIYCQGSTFTQILDAGAGMQFYQWMDGNFTQLNSIDQNDDTVWVEVTDFNNCVNSDTLFVLEVPLPQVDLGPDTSICASQSYTLDAGNYANSISSYLWSTGQANQTITIPPNPMLQNTSVVDYSVTVTDTNSCTQSDTMALTTYPLPQPDLGNDTAYCIGDPFSMTLDPGTFVTYQWSTGASTPTITIGPFDSTYFVTVTDTNGCSNSDDIHVTENPLPNVSLGPDTSFCTGDYFLYILSPGGFVSYQWSDGSNGQILAVSQAGTYSVTVTDINGCENSDDMVVVENPVPPVDISPDQVFCEDDTVNVILDAGAQLPPSGYAYSWNDGTTNPVKIATTFGVYSVTVTNTNTQCADSSKMEIIAFPKANPDLGPDTIICQGEILNLSPKVNLQGYNYKWSTGATTKSINVFKPGVYWVQLDARNNTCMGLTDTVKLSPGVLPVVELGEDKIVCEGQKVKFLDAASAFPGAQYLWQDGSTRPEYTATETGLVRVTVFNKCGSVVDEAYVEFIDCYNVYVPNSFTPNGDGKNDIFKPVAGQELADYNLVIYDRWGNLMFQTNDINQGWDGRLYGKDAPVGVYVWRISYISAFDPELKRIEKYGKVNLIH